jgi:hypothetical protein
MTGAAPSRAETRRLRLVAMIERARARRLGLATINALVVLGLALGFGLGFEALFGRPIMGFWFMMFCAGAVAILAVFRAVLDPKDPVLAAQARILRRLGLRIGWKDDLDVLNALMQRCLRQRVAEGATLSGRPPAWTAKR